MACFLWFIIGKGILVAIYNNFSKFCKKLNLLNNTFVPCKMSGQKKYKFIAAFLLIVFSLNTVVGFACSVGIDMGYNTKHHEHGTGIGMNHHHHENSGQSFNGVNEKDDCCTNNVTSFIQLDKSLVNNQFNLCPPVFLLIVSPAYIFWQQNETVPGVNSTFQFVRRSCFLNDTNIRIAIRSFQI